MPEKFILEYTATEIEAEDDKTRAEYWIVMAAHYVATFEHLKLLNCYETAYRGFRDGWRMLYNANLISSSMDEYLRAAKPSTEFIEAFPRAK